MPRPCKTEATRRIHSVTFWLTPDEYAQLQTAAEQAGLRVNDLARRLTVRGRLRLTLQVTRRLDPAFIQQVRALGINLNQVAMRMNLTGRVSPKVEYLCEEIEQLVLGAVEEEVSG